MESEYFIEMLAFPVVAIISFLVLKDLVSSDFRFWDEQTRDPTCAAPPKFISV